MQVGRYVGVPVDQLPASYLRWIVSQKFPKPIIECAIEKLKQSKYSNDYIHVSRHALDMYSLRENRAWLNQLREKGKDAIGIATFVAGLAKAAWEQGNDISKHRHQDDGVVKESDGIKWVFAPPNPNFPEYLDVITIMD